MNIEKLKQEHLKRWAGIDKMIARLHMEELFNDDPKAKLHAIREIRESRCLGLNFNKNKGVPKCHTRPNMWIRH